jgi:hypothetical protein
MKADCSNKSLGQELSLSSSESANSEFKIVEEPCTSKTEVNALTSLKRSIIEPISSYTKQETESYYRNYFELEGGMYPDLFGCEVSSRNDCLSYVRYIATPRADLLHANLINGLINQTVSANGERKLSKEEQKAKINHMIGQFMTFLSRRTK